METGLLSCYFKCSPRFILQGGSEWDECLLGSRLTSLFRGGKKIKPPWRIYLGVPNQLSWDWRSYLDDRWNKKSPVVMTQLPYDLILKFYLRLTEKNLNHELCVHMFVCHTPSILCAEPYWALVGFWVDAEQVLQAGPSERAPRGTAHGTAVHGALCLAPTSSANPEHPWSAVGTCCRELLLLLAAGGLCNHVLGAWTLIVLDRKNTVWVKGPARVCDSVYMWVTRVFLLTAIAGWDGGVTGLTL